MAALARTGRPGIEAMTLSQSLAKGAFSLANLSLSPLARPLLISTCSSPASSRGKSGQLCPTKPTVSRATLPSGSPVRQGFTRAGHDEKPPATSLFLKTEAVRFRQQMRLSWPARIQRLKQPARPRWRWSGSGVRAPGRFPCSSSPPRCHRRRNHVPPRRNWPGVRARRAWPSRSSPERARRGSDSRSSSVFEALFPVERHRVFVAHPAAAEDVQGRADGQMHAATAGQSDFLQVGQ